VSGVEWSNLLFGPAPDADIGSEFRECEHRMVTCRPKIGC
jgi:hypothetical protein